ncbi:hypothetical protein [Kitasatospora sp. RG8]|nr:hypothetical protein [Kitasatospora sp. RG8]
MAAQAAAADRGDPYDQVLEHLVNAAVAELHKIAGMMSGLRLPG